MALTGQGLANFAISKIGTPYVYGAKGADGVFTQARLNALASAYPSTFTSSYKAKAKKFIGRTCTDCSGLISWYTGRVLGSAQMKSTASKCYTLNKKNTSAVPVGAVLWKTGHVGVYIGNGQVVEAMGIDYGCVKRNVSARSFTHYLLFSYINYGATNVPEKKSSNPYTKPSGTLRKGNKGTGVKWLQYELREAGYNISLDGIFGNGTLNAVKAFQKSCKLTVDGVVGTKTKNALIAN